MIKKNDQVCFLDGELFPVLINWQLASTERYKEIFTLVFLNLPCTKELEHQLKNTDLVFNFPDHEIVVILLPNVGEIEAEVMLKRLLRSDVSNESLPAAAVIEVKNSEATASSLLECGRKLLQEVQVQPNRPLFLADRSFAKIAPQEVSVSVLDEDVIVTSVIRQIIERMDVRDITFTVKEFNDGQAFVQSDWYRTPKIHLVIMNDVLPKKNGIDILHMLRSLPNTQRFYILMMTKRQSEKEMIYAFEHGVDEYMPKPFNPRLLEAQLKKMLNRIYHE